MLGVKDGPHLRRVKSKSLFDFSKIGDESTVFSPYFPFFIDILPQLYLSLRQSFNTFSLGVYITPHHVDRHAKRFL